MAFRMTISDKGFLETPFSEASPFWKACCRMHLLLPKRPFQNTFFWKQNNCSKKPYSGGTCFFWSGLSISPIVLSKTPFLYCLYFPLLLHLKMTNVFLLGCLPVFDLKMTTKKPNSNATSQTHFNNNIQHFFGQSSPNL